MIKQLKQTILVLVSVIGLTSFFLPIATTTVYADTAPTAPTCQNGYVVDSTTNTCVPKRITASCGTNEKPLVTSVNSDGTQEVNDRVCCPAGSEGSATGCMFAKYVNPIIKGLGVLAGIAVVIGIVIGGVQYGSSAGDPQKAAKAKGMITKALLGLVSFMFLYSALQFFSPGGISANNTDTFSSNVASSCSKEFLGLKPWFAYLPDTAFHEVSKGVYSCNIENFSLLGGDGKDSQLVPVFLAIADDLVRIAGLVAVAFVITGGVKYVTSNGEPDKTKQALETIISALVGVAIAIIAAAVVSYIGTQLSK